MSPGSSMLMPPASIATFVSRNSSQNFRVNDAEGHGASSPAQDPPSKPPAWRPWKNARVEAMGNDEIAGAAELLAA